MYPIETGTPHFYEFFLKDMARKGKTEENQEKFVFYNFNRELIRRNSYYQANYKKVVNIADPNLRALRMAYLASNWGLLSVNDLPDPSKRPPLMEIRNLKPNTNFLLPTDIDSIADPERDRIWDKYDWLNPTIDEVDDDFKSFMFITYFPEEGSAQRHAIDFKKSKKEIMDQLTGLAEDIIKERNKNGLEQHSPTERKRIINGFDYLEVYDSHKFEGKKLLAIGLEKWGNVGSPEQKAGYYFKEAKKLIKNPPLLMYLKKRAVERN